MKGERYCKQEAPKSKSTGDLARSITPRVTGSTGEVRVGVGYWRYVVYGTSAHEIKVKDKKVLSDHNSTSPSKKDAIFGKAVTHPGTKPNNFPARAVNRIRGELPATARKYIKVKS